MGNLARAIEQKGIANGYAGLDGSALVPTAQLPSYVDDVVEVATYADLPISGESSKIYVVITDEVQGNDTSTYRWTGSVYALVSDSLSAVDVKSLYESNANTNNYSDADKAKTDATTLSGKGITDAYTKSELTGVKSTPLLDLPLNNSLSMKAGVGSVTYSRATTATYIDRYGVLKYAGIDEPRFEKDGLLIEGGSTNLLAYSNDLVSNIGTGWYTNDIAGTTLVTANYGISPDGTQNSNKVTFTELGKILRTTISGISGKTITVSFYVKGSGQIHRWSVYGATAPETVLNGSWQKVEFTYTSTTDYIDFAYSINELLDMEIAFIQVEELPFASSYIPTTTAAVARSADFCTATFNGNSPDNNQDITFLADFDMFTKDYAKVIFEVVGVVTTRLSYESNGLLVARAGAGIDYSVVSEEDMKTGVHGGLMLNGNQLSWILNGVVSTSPTTVGLDSTGSATSIAIGGNGSSSSTCLFGHIKNFRIYDKALSATEIALA